MNLPRLSCRLEVLPGAGLADKLRHAAEFGFDAVSLPGRQLDAFEGELRNLTKPPLPFAALSLGFKGSLLSPDPERRAVCRHSLVDLFDMCEAAGIPILNMPPLLNQDNPERLSDPGSFGSLRERLDRMLLDQLPALGDAAKRRGVVLALEPVNRYESDYLNSVEHAASLCAALNHANIGLTADFFHMRMEELRIPDALRAAGRHLSLVHVAENTRVEPGPGSTDFAAGFAVLAEIGYRGDIEVECRSLSGSPFEVLPRSVGYLRDILHGAYGERRGPSV